ncbi:helix-turn-helix transcriptional regulator [Cryptosporangium japonicum]|uniref:Helix-turn-helix transcriptional regulator n=1 Tax=Cryptosporangium japonicum TaxID=80872 RepID=A0ABP3E1W5_9ACTN
MDDCAAEVRDFLTTRRARITPERAGLPVVGRRRVKGLRRSEVALLAGMSPEYYAKLERGSLAGASAGVLDAIARALQFDDAERAYLMRLAHEANGSAAVLRPRAPAPETAIRPSLQWTLDAITGPAFLSNAQADVLAANPLGRALLSEMFAGPPNLARFVFLDPAAPHCFPGWSGVADTVAANLRTALGQDAHDQGLCALISELSARSDEFRRRWALHDVVTHATGVTVFRHRLVGELSLSWETLDLRTRPGGALTVYSAEPGSPSADALNLLAAWALGPSYRGITERTTP